MVTQYSWNAVTWQERRKILHKLARRDGFRCNKCKRHGMLTIDHIWSIHFGGPVMDLANMQLLCIKCHAAKTRKEQKG